MGGEGGFGIKEAQSSKLKAQKESLSAFGRNTVKLHPSIGTRIRVITDDYSHETHEKTRNIIYIIVLGLSRRSPAGVQVIWPLWARSQIQESLLSALSFPNPQSTITVLSFPPSRRGVGVGPYGPEAAFRLPTSFLFLLSFPLSALSLEHFCLQPQTAEGPSFSKTILKHIPTLPELLLNLLAETWAW